MRLLPLYTQLTTQWRTAAAVTGAALAGAVGWLALHGTTGHATERPVTQTEAAAPPAADSVQLKPSQLGAITIAPIGIAM